MLANPFLNWVEKIYNAFVWLGSNLQSLFLLYMRLTWGHQLFLAGMAKLKNLPATAELFAKIGIPTPFFHAYLVGLLETVGGLFFLIGFASRMISIPILIVMITALTTVHKETLASFQFIFDPYLLVSQQPYPILITAVLLFLFGPGRVSLDAWLKRWISHQPRY